MVARGRRIAIFASVALAAACQADTVPSTSVSIAPPSTATTTAVTSTTETSTPAVDDLPLDVCTRGIVWEPGTTYVADCFVRPIVFTPDDAGWGSLGGAEGYVLVRWVDPDDRDLYVRIALLTYRAGHPPADALEAVLEYEEISLLGEVEQVEVAGWDGVVAEIEGGPELNAPVDPPCTDGQAVWLKPLQFGHGFFPVDQDLVIGVGACQRVRAWTLDVDGLTVTILAGTEDPADHQVAVDAAERLFATMSFESVP